MGQNLFFVLCAAHDDANAFSGASRLQRCAALDKYSGTVRLWHQLRWVRIESTRPYSTVQGRKGSDRARYHVQSVLMITRMKRHKFIHAPFNFQNFTG